MNYRHWSVKLKSTQKWKRLVRLALGYQIPEKPLVKATLRLTRHSAKSPDADGLVGSFKPLIDGLVAAGVLLDDKMSNIGFPVYEHKMTGRGKGFVEIEVTEIVNHPE